MTDNTSHTAPAAPVESDAVPRRVWSATSWLVLGRLWGAACTFASLGLLGRHLAAADFGRYTFYLTVLILLDGVTDFGTSTAALQRGAHDERELGIALRSARRIRASAASTGWLLVIAGAWLAGERDLGWIALATLAPLTRVLETSAVVLQSRIAWGLPVVVRAGAATLRLLLVLLLISPPAAALGPLHFGPFLAVHALGTALGNTALFLLVRRLRPRVPVRRGPAPGLLRAALPLAATAICQQAYFYVDNLFVRGIRGDVELGRYNAAVRVLSFLIMGSGFATQAALPWLARRRRAGDLGRATINLSFPLLLVGGAALVLLWPVAGGLLRLVFGPGFEEAASALRLLLVAALVIHGGAGLLTAVVASGRTARVLAIVGAGLLVNVLGNAWLVPAHGIEGAALATVATEIVVAAASLVALVLAGTTPSTGAGTETS